MEPRKCKHCDWFDSATGVCTLANPWKEVDSEGLACKDFQGTEDEPPTNRRMFRNIPRT